MNHYFQEVICHRNLKSISRRQFLKTGCITTAVVSLTVCGVGVIAPAPDQTPVDLPAFTYGEKTMNNRVLIAYASHFGSTVDVAAAIGDTLGAHGFSVEVKPIKENPLVEGYQAVLLGSAVHHGNWLPEAVDFVKTNQQILNRLPVALFCVHIQNLENNETSRQNRLAYLNEVRPLVQPVAEGFFAGKFDRRGAALLMPGLLARFVPPLDFRDREKIHAWADSISPLLRQET
jgi:menaquinone-dependent protoporphyrinogen oxidase